MKTIFLVTVLLIIIGCKNQKKFEYEIKEYWGENDPEKDKILRTKYKVYSQGFDTIFYLTNYYESGKLKSKVVMKNDLLMEIDFVLDTLGRKMTFGNFKNGNGYVIRYSSFDGSPENEGLYVNGDKQGWWKNYHFTGNVIDSTFYKDGFTQYKKSKNSLNQLIETFGPMKNNLYQ